MADILGAYSRSTGIGQISIFVFLEDTGEYRQYEASRLPDTWTPADLYATRTADEMWADGVTITDAALITMINAVLLYDDTIDDINAEIAALPDVDTIAEIRAEFSNILVRQRQYAHVLVKLAKGYLKIKGN